MLGKRIQLSVSVTRENVVTPVAYIVDENSDNWRKTEVMLQGKHYLTGLESRCSDEPEHHSPMGK